MFILCACFDPGFIGYAPELASLVTRGQVKVDDDDQLFYTKLFLDAELRVSCTKHIGEFDQADQFGQTVTCGNLTCG